MSKLTDNWESRIVSLEFRAKATEDTINRMEEDTRRCQENQAKNWDKLTERMEKIQKNDLSHVESRLEILERTSGQVITIEQWVKIILTVIGVVGTIMVAYIQVFGGKI